MRAELAALMTELRTRPAASAGTSCGSDVCDACGAAGRANGAASSPRCSRPSRPAPRRIKLDEVDVFDPEFSSEQDVAAMVELFGLVERALFVTQQYGRNHPEAERSVQRAFQRASEGLAEPNRRSSST